MDAFFTATDPLGRTIICTNEAWQHILDHRMDWDPEDNWHLDVIRAIENPKMITTNTIEEEDIEIYYCHPGVRTYYMKVIIKIEGEKGFVKTAFEVTGAKKGEKIKWLISNKF